MKLPPVIEQLAVHGLEHMRAHPKHHFDWRIRRQLYRLFQEEDRRAGQRAHGWLAVIAAEHVLPLFTTTFPQDRLPIRLVRYAKRVLTGSIASTSWRMEILEDQGYMGTGIDMLDLRNGTIAYQAEYAGSAAYKALMEARGTHDLLDHVETLRRHNGYMVMGGGSQKPEYDHYEHGSSFTDEDIAHLAAFSDTASAAAIAYSCEQQQLQIQAERLQGYWEWWVQHALPEAWSRV
jgi:Immunity protein Imm5